MIAGSDNLLNVPVEATAFLGAVAAFAVLLLVFFLYLNKKWCFYSIGGFPCCDEPVVKSVRTKELGPAYNYEEAESSSDSEEEVLQRLQQSVSFPSGLRRATSASLRGIQQQGREAPPAGDEEDEEEEDDSCEGQLLPKHHHRHRHHYKDGGSSVGGPGSGIASPNGAGGGDLISLAEKGKVGGSGASSSASSSSSTASGDDDLLGHRALRHRDPRFYRRLPPARSGECAGAVGGASLRQPGEDESSPAMSEKALSAYTDSVVDQDDTEQMIALLEHFSYRPYPRAREPWKMASMPSLPCVKEHSSLYGELQTPLQAGEEGDGGGLQMLSKCGSLEVAFAYDVPTRKMTIHVLQARDVPNKDRGGATNSQVRVLLLPNKKQKHRTKLRPGDNPQFMESCVFSRINPEDVSRMGVRFRLYGCERMRRERLIGESVVSFAMLHLQLETTLWITLEPRSNLAHTESRADLISLSRSDSTGSTQSMQHGGVPELLLGLVYNGTTGRLAVEVVKGSHFRNLAMTRAPDTYVKLTLVSSNGQEIARSKTSVRRGQPNPLFKETFMFQVALFQLPDVTLMVSVHSKRSMKRKEMVGWFSLGLNSSGEEELSHWNDMRDARGEQVCRWHVLLES